MAPFSKKRLLCFLRRPLSFLSAGVLLVTATGRLSAALCTAGALLWVYGISALAFNAAKPLLPRNGQSVVIVFLTGLIASFFLLFLFLTNPFLALSMELIIGIIPVLCADSAICTRFSAMSLKSAVARALSEALLLSLLLVALSLFREPLGHASLSLPGGEKNIVKFFGAEGHSRLSILFLAVPAGALILLGFMTALLAACRSGLKPGKLPGKFFRRGGSR
jgi:hypothetical protein